MENGNDSKEEAFNYVNHLMNKKKEIERLGMEAKNLENRGDQIKSVRSPPKLQMSPKSEDEIFRRLHFLEKDMAHKDALVERLTYDRKALTEIVKQQEDRLLKMTGELHAEKQRTMKLNHELNTRTAETKMLFGDSKLNYSTNAENQKRLK